MNNQLLKLLIRSFDAELSLSEQQQLQEGLQQSAELRAEKERLLSIRADLGQQEYRFKPFFNARVMNRIEQLGAEKLPDLSELIMAFFPKVAYPSLAIILVLLLNVYLGEGNISIDSIAGIEDTLDSFYTIEDY